MKYFLCAHCTEIETVHDAFLGRPQHRHIVTGPKGPQPIMYILTELSPESAQREQERLRAPKGNATRS